MLDRHTLAPTRGGVNHSQEGTLVPVSDNDQGWQTDDSEPWEPDESDLQHLAELRLTEQREAFGARVRELRQDRGWSQTDLVRRLRDHGVWFGQTTATKLERGNRPTPVEEAWALALVFGVAWDDLMPSLPTPLPPRDLQADLDAARRSVERLQRERDAIRARSFEVTSDLANAEQRVAELRERLGRTAPTTTDTRED